MTDILVGIVIAVVGVGLGAFRVFDGYSVPVTKKAVRFFGVVLVGVGLAFLTRVLSITSKPDIEALEWREDAKEALEQAKTERRPALLDATADWCASCKKLEKETFSDPKVV